MSEVVSTFDMCFSKSLFFIGGEFLYNVLLASAIYQHESIRGIHVSLPLTLPPTSHPVQTHLGYHRGTGWAPCTIQQLPISYLFLLTFKWNCLEKWPSKISLRQAQSGLWTTAFRLSELTQVITLNLLSILLTWAPWVVFCSDHCS